MKTIRQGDVLLMKIDKLPETSVEKDNVLARGEATGHSHKIMNGKVLQLNSQQYVVVEKEAILEHEEHDNIEIPQGIYEVRIQREYNPIENRQVMD